ncbi:MAG: DUF429 domain-containing protein [Deltaproteobacteria bacterium]|nr:DUF429 domain-containing protein [Deltaproteobacteria bacterium]
MLTVGVDIAKGRATTAICVVRWDADAATVEVPVVGADDAAILAAATAPEVAAVAFDAPFGWPTAMVSAVSSWRPGGRWASPSDAAFRLRRTDVAAAARTKATVAARRTAGEPGLQPAVPLSVAADKIAMAAWRCCALLDALAVREAEVVTDTLGVVFPPDGRRRVIEAYPAAALAMWGVPREGYKATGAMAVSVRKAILAVLEQTEGRGWVHWVPHARERCASTDHALDAFICALVARAAQLGFVEAVPSEHAAAARAEGWIAVPHREALQSLVRRAGTS